MSDRLELVFRATVDEASKQQILQEIDALESKFKPMGVKIDVSEASENIEQIVQNFDHLEDGSKNLTSETRKLSTETGRYVKEMYKVVDGHDDLQLKKSQEVKNIKLSTDQIHKQRIAQESLLNQVRKTVELNERFIERGGLGGEYVDLEKSIRELDPTSRNFNNLLAEQNLKFKQLGTDVSIVKKEVNDLSRYASIFGQSLIEAGCCKFSPLYREPVNAGCMIHV